jgi:GNAT superfamily N-acetyltransferase
MGGVRKEALPKKLGRRLPPYDIGMVLPARLAIERELHGRGYGRDLMIAAVEEAAVAGQHAAARFIAVDPIDAQTRRFCAKYGFADLPDDPGGRMFMRIDEAIATLSDNT